MPRKSHRPLPVPAVSPLRRRSVPWAGYALTAFVSMALGSGGTLLAIHRQAPRASVIGPLAPSSGPLAPDNRGTGGEPPAALTQDLPPAEAALKLGNWYLDHGNANAAKASAFYSQAIQGGIDNANIRTDLGTSFRLIGQPRQALEQYALAQKQDPRHENSLFNQAVVYAGDLNNVPRAVAIWRQYLQLFPHGQHVREARAFIAQASSSTPKP